MANKKPIWIVVVPLVVFASFLLLFVSGNFTGGSSAQVKGYATIEFSHGKLAIDALCHYAEEHGGNFPKSLDDPVLNTIPPEARYFHVRNTKQEIQWLYYTGYNRQSPSETIILASPLMVSPQKRLAYFPDGSGRILDEDRFLSLLSVSLNRR